MNKSVIPGIAQSVQYRLVEMEFKSRQGQGIFSPFQKVYPASYLTGTDSKINGGKPAGA
jgi:hypothetical protein